MMKALIRVSSLSLGCLLVSFVLAAKDAKKAVVWPAGEVKWTANPAVKGAWIAALWGDPNKGAYGALKKVTAGTDFGWHTHTNEQKVVAIAGAFEFTLEGGSPQNLIPGSYVYVPARTKHKSVCLQGTDCVWFEEQPGKSDLVPAK